jgi:hypothetical protein
MPVVTDDDEGTLTSPLRTIVTAAGSEAPADGEAVSDGEGGGGALGVSDGEGEGDGDSDGDAGDGDSDGGTTSSVHRSGPDVVGVDATSGRAGLGAVSRLVPVRSTACAGRVAITRLVAQIANRGRQARRIAGLVRLSRRAVATVLTSSSPCVALP